MPLGFFLGLEDFLGRQQGSHLDCTEWRYSVLLQPVSRVWPSGKIGELFWCKTCFA